MKKLLGVLVVSIAMISVASAQLVVRIRPTHERVVRIAAPSPRHVWIDEDWRYEGNNYVYNGGRWVEPPAGYHRWIPGHWKNSPRRGWVWKPGRWA
jgi:hypothetical protein